MRTPDPTAERAIAESRLRSIIAPARRPPRHAQRDGERGDAWAGHAVTAAASPAGHAVTGSASRAEHAVTGAASRAGHTVAAAASRAEGSWTDGSTNAAQPSRKVPSASVPPTFQAFREAVATQAPALDPGRPGLRVLLALGALAIVVAAFVVWRSQPSPEPLPPPTPITPSTPSPTAKVTVHVAGKIRKPGVYLLPSGARVTDAVTAAGGVSRGTSTGSLNLARRLIDGEQIVVGAAQGAAAPGSPVTDPAGAVLDLNSATNDQLEELPGVGEVLAARIAEFRDSHGGFTAVEQLREVSGIGDKKFEEIKPKVRV
ncbi:helix-hairpin-helix domain-containing protein [Nonomuraea cypriaca]|uniref:helix-hairpin-helix domain-containing protein n=1 Tax=Nonomuraea cypriaca TaxID=1187855 RepID=UPI002E2B33A3|nr:helix-hairpin-helix domain-containing protein [Nonomuraea cypriaca]